MPGEPPKDAGGEVAGAGMARGDQDRPHGILTNVLCGLNDVKFYKVMRLVFIFCALPWLNRRFTSLASKTLRICRSKTSWPRPARVPIASVCQVEAERREQERLSEVKKKEQKNSQAVKDLEAELQRERADHEKETKPLVGKTMQDL